MGTTELTDLLYPEHTKLLAINDKSQAIGEFIEWLASKRMGLGQWEGSEFVPASISVNAILAEHFGIDLKALEAEKRAMLDAQREANDARA